MPLNKKDNLSVITTGAEKRGPVVPGLVTVRIIGARGVKSLEILGKPDTYVVVTYAGQAFKTKVVDDCEDPDYNEDIVSTAGLETDAFVDIAVMEKYNVKDELLGAMRIPVDAFAHNVLEASWFELERDGEVTGELCIALRFTPMALPMGGLLAGAGASVVGAGAGPIEQAAQYFSGPRPWYMRYGFYYDLSKRVYRRVKSLPVLSLTATVSETVVEGVLSKTIMRPGPGAVAESSVARLDHVVAGLISTIDDGIDHAKDTALRTVVDVKQSLTGQKHRQAAAAAAAQAQGRKSSGRIWWAVEGTVHNVARPVASYVPVFGGLVVRTLDYIVPPPPSAPKQIPTATVVATPVGHDDGQSAFEPVKK